VDVGTGFDGPDHPRRSELLVTNETRAVSDLSGTQWVGGVPLGTTLVLAVGSIIFIRHPSWAVAKEAWMNGLASTVKSVSKDLPLPRLCRTTKNIAGCAVSLDLRRASGCRMLITPSASMSSEGDSSGSWKGTSPARACW
jgi:hypothetical protein